MAHLVSVIFYFPERIKENPLVLLNVWSGLSSFGGFLGAFLAFLYYTKKEKIPRLPYADSVALGLAVGWIFGRTGCFTAHDHPGRHTSFFLSVNYPGRPAPRSRPGRAAVHDRHDRDPVPVPAQAAAPRPHHRPWR